MRTEGEVVEVDGEDVEVIRTQKMSVVPEKRDLLATGQTNQGVALFEERAKNSKRLLAAALKLTTPSQWMVYGNGENRAPYATGGAADRILRHGFGMKWGKKEIEISSDDEALVVKCIAKLLNPDGSVYEQFIGTRRGERRDDGGIKGYLKHEQDLIKGAIQNMKHVAVTDILGLRFMSPKDFKEVGLDLDRLDRKVEFQDHTNHVDTSELTVPFGKNKGKRPSELNDKQLDWYIEAAEKGVNDPAKAKWKDKNQLWLDALLADKARRANSDQPQSEPVKEEPATNGDTADEMPKWDDLDETGS